MLLLRRVRAVLSRVRSFSRERGAVVVSGLALWVWSWFTRAPGRRSRARLVRVGRRAGCPTSSTHYHYTWLNERAVEVALALDLLERHPGASVLEVGNVLGHYAPFEHTVVDKYEQASGVLNEDVADLDLGRQFDLVLAISTLEHVGLDEDVRDDDKPLRALERLRAHVAPGGRLWVRTPSATTRRSTRGCATGCPGSSGCVPCAGTTRNEWREVPLEQAWGTSYDRLLYTAHAIVVAELDAPESGPAKSGADEVTDW